MSAENCERIVYWNCLAQSNNAAKIDYIDAIQSEYDPDIIMLTEAPVDLEDALAARYNTLDMGRSIKGPAGWEGLVVASSEHLLKIERTTPWPIIELSSRYDAREIVVFDVPIQSGVLAVRATHVTHPHHLHHPSLNFRRPIEWQENAKEIQGINEEGKHFAWFADTNTFLASTVRRKLKLEHNNGVLLDHEGGRTWQRASWQPDTLYLDRCAVSKSLKQGGARLITLQRTIGGVICPSDHRPILLQL